MDGEKNEKNGKVCYSCGCGCGCGSMSGMGCGAGGCGGGCNGGGCGCGGGYGMGCGRRHGGGLMRILITVILALITFWIGVRIGEARAIIAGYGDGYGYHYPMMYHTFPYNGYNMPMMGVPSSGQGAAPQGTK